MRILFIFFYLFFISSCGFTPIYKMGGNGFELDNLSVDIMNDVSYDASQEIKKLFGVSRDDSEYKVMITVDEEFVPVIINTNGTVSKYQINITMSFEVVDSNDMSLLSDISVGLAQYDVQTSEIENEELRKQMLRSATYDAASLMVTKIQSKLSFVNDN